MSAEDAYTPVNYLVANFLGIESPIDLGLIESISAQLGDRFSLFMGRGVLEQQPRPYWDREEETSKFVTVPKIYVYNEAELSTRFAWEFGPKNRSESMEGVSRERGAVEVLQVLSGYAHRWLSLAQIEGAAVIKQKDIMSTGMQVDIEPKFVIPNPIGGERLGNAEELHAYLDLAQFCIGPIDLL